MTGLAKPAMLDIRMADERDLSASNSNPVCIVDEHDSPVGPNNQIPVCVPVFKAW